MGLKRSDMDISDQSDVLRRQLVETENKRAQLEGLLVQRGAVNVGQFMDGLKAIINGARAGNPQAVSNLQELVSLLDEARSLSSGVVPVRGILTPPPNGKR